MFGSRSRFNIFPIWIISLIIFGLFRLYIIINNFGRNHFLLIFNHWLLVIFAFIIFFIWSFVFKISLPILYTFFWILLSRFGFTIISFFYIHRSLLNQNSFFIFLSNFSQIIILLIHNFTVLNFNLSFFWLNWMGLLFTQFAFWRIYFDLFFDATQLRSLISVSLQSHKVERALNKMISLWLHYLYN